MKIWNVICDNDGGLWVETFASEAAALERFGHYAAIAWDEECPDQAMPADARAAYSALADKPGFLDFLSIHPGEVIFDAPASA